MSEASIGAVDPGAAGGTEPLAQLLDLDQDLLSAPTRADLRDGLARAQAGRVNVVVLGAFKRGKSSLINALLERDLLPTGVLPLTSVTTVVAAGERDLLRVDAWGDGRLEHPIEQLESFVTERGNPSNERRVAAARVELSHPLLDRGLQLVDTPGVASVHAHNTATAHAAVGRLDAALCVVAADQPLAEAELELFRSAASRAGRVLVAVNRIDAVGPRDLAAATAFVLDRLRAAGVRIADGDVFAVSARTGSGIVALRAALAELAQWGRDPLLSTSAAATLRVAAAELERSAAAEAAALQLPLDELDERVARLARRLEDLAEARRDAEDLLRRRLADAVGRRVDEPLLGFARAGRAHYEAGLAEHLASLGSISPRRLAPELDRWIDARVRADLGRLAPEVERGVGAELAELQLRHAHAIGQIMAELDAAIRQTLGVALPATPPQLAIREPSRLRFKLHDPEHAVDVIAAAGRTLAPGPLGRRLVARAARERLHAMMDRHAGRLRSELSARVDAAADDYVRELGGSIELAARAVRDAVQRARELRIASAADAEGRLMELERVARRAHQLATGEKEGGA